MGVEANEPSDASLQADYDAEDADAEEDNESNLNEGSDSKEPDEFEDDDMAPSSPVTTPPPIDFDAVHKMKKSKIWALVESREDALHDFQGMVKSRWHDHKKQDRTIRRDWKAVVAKFDSLRAAPKADQAEIDAMASRIKAQKNEIRKLKSLVYKLR